MNEPEAMAGSTYQGAELTIQVQRPSAGDGGRDIFDCSVAREVATPVKEHPRAPDPGMGASVGPGSGGGRSAGGSRAGMGLRVRAARREATGRRRRAATADKAVWRRRREAAAATTARIEAQPAKPGKDDGTFWGLA